MPQTTTANAIITAVKTNLVAQIPLDATRVKIVDMATFKGKLTESAQEKTILLTFGDMKQVNPGGGRSALVERNLLVQMVTISYNDPGGRAEVALAAHWAFEDQVAAALLLYRPVPAATGFPLTFDDLSPVNFDLPVDPGRYRSAYQFPIQYQLNVSCFAPTT